MYNIDKLVGWIKERNKIKLLKGMNAEKPWSEDKVFQQVYFCNVRREDDKVTKWIRDTFHQYDSPQPELNMLIARFVNKPESLEAMGWPFREWDHHNTLAFLMVMGRKGAWGNAYIVSTNGKKEAKHTYVAILIGRAVEALGAVRDCKTLEEAHKNLMEVDGIGSFMAAQIVADLKNTPTHPLHKAEDWWTWCAHGPGSLRGMAWVYDMKNVTPSNFRRLIPEVRKGVDKELNRSIPKFCNQDLQNCLCEFDKYMRVSTGTGRSKRNYDGTISK